MSILDLLLPLASGAATVIAPTEALRDPGALLKLMERHSVTMIQATPSFWQMLLDGGWKGQPRLVKILTAGEPISRRLLDRLLAYGDMVWNGYGPTEATVYASVGRVSQDEQDIVIGHPIANFQLYVLNPKDLTPMPIGGLGEVYIGGCGVNCGYRNKPDMTKERFLDNNPFHPGRLYRTGDLARFLAPGKLKLVGRIDSQVKVRGYRIELEDISAAITEHEEVSAAVVVTRDDQLVAYFMRNNGNQQKPLDHVLRAWLAQRRPAYMMPAFFVEMDTFPMTLNGKIDRKALPDPTKGVKASTAQPQTELERRVLAVWSQVLGHTSIGINDNFFEVGGNSVRLPRVKAGLEELVGRPVQMAKLFEYYTIKTLAAYLECSQDEGHITTSARPPSDPTLRGEAQQQSSSDRPSSSWNNEDIAIISMACRFPGGITSPEEFWELLETGNDVITEVPQDRWDADALYDADPAAPGKSHCRRGGFIRDGVGSFDAPFFGISPREARTLDPTQHVMLETCWEGLERAGYTMKQLRGSLTGVFIGHSQVAAHSVSRDLADLDGYAVTGSIGATLSGRTSYVLGLEGPSLTVDTACSSSLVSTHLACTSLRQGECDMAVAGGVTLMLSPGLMVEFTRLGGISPDGSCHAFSADSQGTGFSEGSAVVVLKRLSDAQRDGDTIQAVLRGSAINHGGRRAASLTTPSGAAQVHLIRTALGASGLTPSDIDYIEAHGTATKLGDPIEGTALAEVFSNRSLSLEPLWVGSAKSNLGHTQASAGLASLLKVVLAMQHRLIPKTLHVTEPTPLVDWHKANMALVLENKPWPSTHTRRAGVSSFGIGGTNAHIIVEEAPPSPSTVSVHSSPRPSLSMVSFVVSGQNNEALHQQVKKLHRHLQNAIPTNGSDYLGDVAYSLAVNRTHFRRRLAFIANDEADLLKRLASCADAQMSERQPPAGVIHSTKMEYADRGLHLAMLFTGQGSQRLGMGKRLYQVYPTFRKALEEVVAYFPSLETPLLEVMWAEPQSDAAKLLDRTDYAQPAIFSVEVALWRLWQSWGVHPQVVLGHSVGELAAVHVAGVLDLSDACRLVAARGHLMQALAWIRRGSMVSLEATGAETTAAMSFLHVQDKVDIAGYNTPMQTVVSGDKQAIEAVAAHFAGKLSRKVKMLDVSQAFHSSHMDDMLPLFRAVVKTLQFSPPKLPVISSLTGLLAEEGQLEQPEYWVQQARQAVRFSDSIQTIYHQHGIDIFLELGPHPVLLGLTAACLTGHQCHGDDDDNGSPLLLPSLRTGKQDDISVVRRSLAELHVRNVPIDWLAYFKPWSCQSVTLPTYAFQRDRWYRQPRAISVGLNGNTVVGNDQADGPPSCGDTDRFQFEVVWHRLNKENVQLEDSGRSWGLICPAGNGKWASTVTRALSQAGIRLTRVQRLEEAQQLDGLLSLWDTSSPTDIPRRASQHTTQALTQLQMAATTSFPLPLVWVTCQAVGTGGYDADPGQMNGLGTGPLWGLMRTARNEHPELRLRLIDLDEEKGAPEALLLALTLSEEPECAVRQGQVLMPRLQQVKELKPVVEQQRLFLRQDGAVLITGGLGGIGKRVARWLATTHHVHDLVLISRRGMEDSGAAAFVAELSQFNSRATVIACDVADFESLKLVMAMFSVQRPLRGVIHAAGVVDNGILSAMTPQRCATTSAPKVDGAWNLHLLTQGMDLDVFMMFSSIAGVLGMPGLGNYAAANAFLDALAHQRRAQNLPATSVAYGVWEGEGMAAGLTGRTTLTHLAKFGLDPLKPEEGLKLLEQAIHRGRALTVAAALDPERLRIYLKNEHAERGGIPSFYSKLLSEPERNGSSNEPRNSGRGGNLRTALSKAPAGQHEAIVLAMVRETVAKTLGFTSAGQVDVDIPLQDIGFDSLTAVLLRNRLSALTSLKTLSAGSITWQYPNLRSLSHFLLSQVQSETQAQSKQCCSVSDHSRKQPVNSTTYTMEAAPKGHLGPDIAFDNIGEVQRPRSVFVTGATGFVGAFILRELLELGIAAHCLVRAEGVKHGQQRLVESLAGYDLWKHDYAPLLNPVVGDAAKPLFGLTNVAFDDLANRVDAICHSGALVDWLRPLNDYIGPNVISTHEVLRLASRGRGKAVHVISTLATLPMHMGYDVPEHDREYGYSTSKYIAERMVAAARWRGARASVYRVPFVAASAATGHFRVDRGEFLHNLIAGSIQMGSFPSLDADLSVVQPVDYLSKTVVAIMVHDRSRIGHDFDFVNKHAVSCNHFFQLMGGDDAGTLLPFHEWQLRALAYAAAHPKSALARIGTIIDGLADESALAAMLKGLPTGEHVLGGDVYPAPLVDEQLARHYRDRIDMSNSDGPISSLEPGKME